MAVSFVLTASIGLSACSQKNQDKTKTDEASLTKNEPISVTMYKNPNCQCCSKWATYLENNGFSVEEIPTDTLASVKKQKGVPDQLGACHTALIDGYVVEGHVSVGAINKLLNERPETKGIAVPGMPAESPGMAENPGSVDVYFFNGPDQVAYFDKF